MRSALARALAVGFTAAAVGAASVGTAAASTTHKHHSDAVQPYGACSGDPGPFVEVAVDYGRSSTPRVPTSTTTARQAR